jgi:PAS domain S-box-containing protein
MAESHPRSPGPPDPADRPEAALRAEVADLRRRLEEAEQVVDAIRRGAVDAFLIAEPLGERVYTLETADRPYRVLVDCIQEGALTLAGDGTILFCNRRFVEMVGGADERLVGRNLEEHVVPAERAGLRGLISAARAGVTGRAEVGLSRPGASPLPVHLTVSPLDADAGATLGAVVMDLTEQKRHDEVRRSREAVQESERRFRSMADGTPVILWVHDASGRLQFVNRSYCEFFGVSQEHVQDDGWRPLLHPDDAHGYVDAFLQALREGTPFHAVARVRRADGEWRWIESFGAPRLGPGGECLGLAGSSPDITERVQAEQRLRVSEVQLLEAMQGLRAANQDLDRFASVVAHDLQEPMRTARAFSSTLAQRYAERLDDEGREILELIQASAARGQDLVTALLSFSRNGRSPAARSAWTRRSTRPSGPWAARSRRPGRTSIAIRSRP